MKSRVIICWIKVYGMMIMMLGLNLRKKFMSGKFDDMPENPEEAAQQAYL